ncbi:MAG: DUF2116 family Zn-ribbon domain-containing protein [Candidatus Methanomethylophilaceae archaeon]|jgi:predicted nucleic acid-binding Zn ribbon protein|nr:DUF2116 family Zn-ribbon domain-containing protein [Candidatus Methanomethylophilaceae archaeon]
MALRLPPHSHCLHCESPLPEGEEFCSEECARAHSLKEGLDKRKNLLFYAGVAVVALALLSLRLIL